MNPLLVEQIVEDKKNGISDEVIGKKYGVPFRQIERAITQQLGINISNPKKNKKSISLLEPKLFELETKTVWSFKSRGTWATHNGNYRGNWSPYIPRNVILKYSNEGDLVLDYFCGGGTTAVECKLLNRDFIGIDINPAAIELTKENLNFENKAPGSNLELKIGDARRLSSIHDNSIDLICAHPPYADIVNYTHDNPNDLSSKEVNDFIAEIEKVAKESFRVLKPDAYCAILIGDMRKNKNVITLGFQTIEKYLAAGFKIKELIVKRQHNCKTTGFWYTNSVKYNFLLLAHEFLVIFKKSGVNDIFENKATAFKGDMEAEKDLYLESTTVWIFNEDEWESKVVSNLIKRYSAKKPIYFKPNMNNANTDLIINIGAKKIDECFKYADKNLRDEGIIAVICEDVRGKRGFVCSAAMEIEKNYRNNKGFTLKELVVISVENGKSTNSKDLEITHKYLLIYKKTQL